MFVLLITKTSFNVYFDNLSYLEKINNASVKAKEF